jgi:hypothetical protein
MYLYNTLVLRLIVDCLNDFFFMCGSPFPIIYDASFQALVASFVAASRIFHSICALE